MKSQMRGEDIVDGYYFLSSISDVLLLKEIYSLAGNKDVQEKPIIVSKTNLYDI